LLDRKIGRLCTFENLVDIGSGAPMQINEARSIGHQAADIDIVPEGMRRRQAAVCRQVHDPLSLNVEHWV